MDEQQQRIYSLMVTAEDQQKMAGGMLAKLDAEIGTLARERGLLRQMIDQSVKQSMSGVADTVAQLLQGAIKPSADALKASVGMAHDASNRLSESMDRVQSAWTWRLLGLSAGVLSIVSLTAYGLVWWERSQVEDLKSIRQSLQADINRMQPVVRDLEKRGGRLVWNNCGGKWCLQVESGNWRDNTGPLAIPRGF